jgi:hypothetical protein
VAIKVINLARMPPVQSQKLVQTYLNEVSLLERLRQESNHVVFIHDFDFDPRTGRGKFQNFRNKYPSFIYWLFSLYCYGIRW